MQNSMLHAIKRDKNFLTLTTDELKFLNLRNYLAPSNSLALFLKHYGATERKGFFPYEEVKSVNDLYKPGLPSRRIFFDFKRGDFD